MIIETRWPCQQGEPVNSVLLCLEAIVNKVSPVSRGTYFFLGLPVYYHNWILIVIFIYLHMNNSDWYNSIHLFRSYSVGLLNSYNDSITKTIPSLAEHFVLKLIENIESEGAMAVACLERTGVPLPVLVWRPVLLPIHGHQYLLHWVGHQHRGLIPPMK